MSNGNALLALTLGVGGGLALAYLRREEAGPARSPGIPGPSGRAPADTPTRPLKPQVEPPTVTATCTLRLDGKGLTADGLPVDVAGAVARCKAAGRAKLLFAEDGPASVYVDLNRALSQAGVSVTVWKA